ncbi:hypothetical protein GCM10011344_29350 [Dokdonia pacifica]|uniref:Uncharacterized protein n=1 Tax=Dokdonia pacifica TaxID=1627892 RepID=A0A239C5T3_9FLAO|nr:hypothetical protein [Dokdonia pacifica]GGG26715.1 hypothetical protein GCM10011344_29350 [Dokdonia pacifica]SNS14784.1 hypothetical protein SAMN06265376_107108 [Dokdonia pacifica]
MRKFGMIKMLSMAVMVLIAIGCSDNEDEVTSLDAEPTAADLLLSAQVDTTEDASYAIVENLYIENVDETRASIANSFFADCAVITVTPNGDGSGSVLVDFGDGCELTNGAIVSGQVNLVYASEQGNSRTITYTYTNFTYNGNEVSGGGTVQRVFENENGNPESDVTSAITVYFPEQDVTAIRDANRVREWIEGVGSGTWTDNVFHVTGNWNTSVSNGFMRSGEVLETLRREASCPHFVSGTLAITRNNVSGTLNYGDGVCDNIAIVTIGNQDFTIQL